MDAYRELFSFASPQFKDINYNYVNQNSIKHIKPVKYGGGYCFKGSSALETVTRNRFLYWRISGSALELQDVSFDFQILEGGLRIVFQNASIACEPGIFETADKVVALVTTTTGIYRFQFPHPNALIKGKSVLSTNSPLPSIFTGASSSSILGASNYYMFPANPSMTQFTCSSTCQQTDNSSLFSFSNQAGNVIFYRMAPSHSLSANVSIYEVKQVGVMSRLLGGIVTSVVGGSSESGNACSDMCILQDALNETLVCAVTWDFRLKIWSANNCEMVVNEDVFTQAAAYVDRNKVTSAGSKNMIRKFVGEVNGEQVILLGVFLNIPNNLQFHVYQVFNSGNSYSVEQAFIFFDDQEKDLIDFTLNTETFWTVWSSKNSEHVIKYEHLNNQSLDSTWSEVKMTPKIPEEFELPPFIDPRQLYLERIFAKDLFSKDAIIRALSTFTHQPGSFVQRLKLLTRKELMAEVSLAVEEQIRLSAADVDFEVQESEYLEMQVQHWSTLYCHCQRNEERNRKVLGIFRDPTTGLSVLVRDKCFSTLRACDMLDQYYADRMLPDLKRFREFYPKITFDENLHKQMGKLLTCLRLMSTGDNEAVWNDNFDSPSFKPLSLAQKHAHLLVLTPERDFDTSVKQLGVNHLGVIKFTMELIENSLDILNYYNEDMDVDVDGSGEGEDVLKKLFSSNKGMKVLVEAVKQSNEARYHLSRGLLVLCLYIRNCSINLTGTQAMEVEQLVGHLSHLVGSVHAILWCASTKVRAADLCCIDKTKKSLELLSLFKHDSNFDLLESEENSMTILELFILAGGREEVFNRFSGLLKNHFSVDLWRNALPLLANLISMIMRPDLSGHILPFTLFNCCQHIQLQHWANMVLKFTQRDFGTLKFFLGLSYLATNEPNKALICFKEVRQYISAEEFLIQLVAEADPLYMETIYAMKIMSLFEEFEHPELLVNFAKFTVESGDNDDPNLTTIWMKIFKSELELCHYESAYDALFKNPDHTRQKDCLRQFLAILCEKKEYKTLVSLRYRSREVLVEKEAAAILESRARSGDVTKNSYYDLLYAFHIHRRNFRCAASVMYDCATRWGQEVSGLEGLEKMVECLTISHNCLQLVDQRNAWIVKLPSDSGNKRNLNISIKHTSEGLEIKHIPARSKSHKHKVEVLDIKAIEKELVLSSSLLSVHQSFGDKSKKMIPMRVVTMKAEEVVGLLCNSGLYDRAFQLSKFFELSFVPVFESLVLRCIGLCNKPAISSQTLSFDSKQQNDWLEYNVDTSCVMSKKYMTASDRAWGILRTNLENFETASSTRGYRCCALKMFYNNFPLPSWFTASYKKLNPAELMTLYCEYGHLQEASDLALEYVEAVAGKGKDYFGLKDYLHAGSAPVWLPYKVIDNILYSYDALKDPAHCLVKTNSLLREALTKHFKLVEHSSKAVIYATN